jgi:hypothetical protein
MTADGRSDGAMSYGSVEKHVTHIFTKPGPPPSQSDHRWVLAVPRYLES